MEYHLAIHLTGTQGRDVTLIDLQTLKNYFHKILVKKFVMCIEPANRDHLHAVFELNDKRPNIKRDIIKSLKIDTKKYTNNSIYCKRLKLGQKFNILAGGYLTKGYKHILVHNISHIEMEEGKIEYENLKDRKVIKLTKCNIIRYYMKEAKKLEIKNLAKYDETVILHMLRNKHYNFSYIIGKIEKQELAFMVHFEVTEPSQEDILHLDNVFYKKPKEYNSW